MKAAVWGAILVVVGWAIGTITVIIYTAAAFYDNEG